MSLPGWWLNLRYVSICERKSVKYRTNRISFWWSLRLSPWKRSKAVDLYCRITMWSSQALLYFAPSRFLWHLVTCHLWPARPKAYHLTRPRCLSRSALRRARSGSQWWCWFHPVSQLDQTGESSEVELAPTAAESTLETDGGPDRLSRLGLPFRSEAQINLLWY